MTDVLTMPGVQTLRVTELTTRQKVAWIEDMAGTWGLTRDMTLWQLRRACHESLAGEALMDAWLVAENAITCRNATERDDGDYEMYEDRAADAIHDLIHGTGTARGRGETSTGDWTA